VAERASPPSLSVLIPCWNAERSIERALASVLETRDVGLECIVVDDASTDGTAAIVHRLAEGDSRIVFVRLEANMGVSVARNRGLELVHGDWLTLVDADDRLLSGGLGSLAAAASSTNALAVIGQQVWASGDRRWLGREYDIPDIRRPGPKSLARNPGLLYFASPHGKLFHRSCFAGLQFQGRVLGDQPWTIRALLRAGDRIEVIGETVYEWRRPANREPSTITTRTRASAQLGVDVVEMAGLALVSVRQEIAASLPDPGAKVLVETAYVERLLRSDIGGILLRAVLRGDRSLAPLLSAIERFVRSVPPAILATSVALPTDILAPPLRHWYRLSPDARIAYWACFDAALESAPGVADRARSSLVRTALRMAGPGIGVGGHTIITAILSVAWVAALARVWLRARLPRDRARS
jgi:hypothetical protein